MAPLLPRSVRYAVENGPVLVYSSPLCADTLELMMAVLRTTRGWAQFGFHGRTRARQQTLFSLRTVRHPRQRLARRAMHNAALAAGTMWLMDTPKIEKAAVANG